MRSVTAFLSTTALLAALAFVPTSPAQIVVNIGVQPTCAYGYYDYAPYACSPRGYYGSGYFYNGIFLGMGPWAGWGYGHGWGGHRFVNDGGGTYHGGGGLAANHSHFAASGGGVQHTAAVRTSTVRNAPSNHSRSDAGGVRPAAGHPAPNRSPATSHASPAHNGAGGGGHEGGGDKH